MVLGIHSLTILIDPMLSPREAHSETVNHCGLTYATFRAKVKAEGLKKQVSIPQDKDILMFSIE